MSSALNPKLMMAYARTLSLRIARPMITVLVRAYYANLIGRLTS
jgi:hypothetical protein